MFLLLQQHEQAAGAISSELAAAATAAVGQMLKQAVERIGRIRGTASLQIKRLLSAPALAAAVPGASAVLQALPLEGEEQGEAAAGRWMSEHKGAVIKLDVQACSLTDAELLYHSASGDVTNRCMALQRKVPGAVSSLDVAS